MEKTPTLFGIAVSTGVCSFFVKTSVGGAGQGSSLVGVLESCADSHGCGGVSVVGFRGLVEYFEGDVVFCIWLVVRKREL